MPESISSPKQNPTGSHQSKPLLGISSCLLGEAVRFDGTDKRADKLLAVLGRHFELRGFCPEVEIGLGVPRETIHLISTDAGAIRCVGTQSAELDVTERLGACARRQSPWLAIICGYVFKARSPSCGLQSTPLYQRQPNGDLQQRQLTSGLFAGGVAEQLPSLPLIQEDTLTDPQALQCFIDRALQYALSQTSR